MSQWFGFLAHTATGCFKYAEVSGASARKPSCFNSNRKSGPIRLDLAVLDLLRPGDDLSQPLTLDGRRDSVVTDLLPFHIAPS